MPLLVLNNFRSMAAAIAAEHCKVLRADETDWAQILRLYDQLQRIQPTPVVSLNRAVAIAMVHGPRQGLAQLDASPFVAELENYHLLHAARADFLRRLNLRGEAARSYSRALALVTNDSERRYLERRLREMSQTETDSSVNI